MNNYFVDWARYPSPMEREAQAGVKYSIDDITNESLERVSDMLSVGVITEDTAKQYIKLWNVGKFTVAEIRGCRIVNSST